MAVDVLNPVNMNCELLATCNALGYLEENVYQKEPDCLETVKDLIRFLRREDETCNIRRQLGHAQILQNDLVPLAKQYHKDVELFETCIRLLVNLTQPAELCFQNVPDDKTFRNYFLEVLSHLQAYKQAFASQEFMAVLARKLKKMLDMEWESRREEHTLLMERILLLVRNILHIPADPNAEKRTDDDASVHDQVLWALNVSGMDKLILYIASAEGEQQWCMHAIEIISHMLREQTPESIATAGTAQQASERLKEERELEALRQRELAEKRARALKTSSRHSRFGGSFYMKNFKSISERDLIYHRSIQDAKSISFEKEKGPSKKPKNRLPMKDSTINRRSTLSIRLFLKDFCTLLLDNCYNPLMYAVKDHILHRRAQENDESYYLWAMHFLMQFSRLYKFRIDVISETFSVHTFHYVDTQITKYLDMMTTDKKEAPAWSKRMHLAVKAYRELLATLDAMTGPQSDPELRESAKVIQSNIFYVVEYREIFLTLLKKFDEVRCTMAYLKDVIETTHLYVRMLEKYSKSKTTMIVQKKARRKAKRRKRQQQQQQEGEQSHQAEEEALNDTWDIQLASDLSAMLQGREDIPENVVPFDAASELPVEEQRADAMVRIQQSLRSGQAGESLALFRAAREVWPEGEVFGAADIGPEDEFMALREIHFTNLNVPTPPDQAEQENGEEQEEMDEEDEEEMEEQQMVKGEEVFNFGVFVNKFSHPDILRSYITLFTRYRSNTAFTNHCIVKLLHRIAISCEKVPLLYQMSLFRVFHKILMDPLVKTNDFKEMAKFGQYLVGQFFKALPSNPKLVVELLFWKDARDVYEIKEGYGSKPPSKKSKALTWTEEEQAELAGLFEQYRDVDGGGDKDVVDLVMEHIIDDNKTRRQIITQLVKQELVDSAKDLKKKRGTKKKVWREEHELELRALFDEHKDSDDPIGSIIAFMTEPRSRQQVMDKIMQLGLVQERRLLFKRRKRGGGTRRSAEDGFLEDAGVDDDDDLEEFPSSEPEFMSSSSSSDDDVDDGVNADDDNDDDDADDDDGDMMSLEDMVIKVQKKGFVDQIRWIQEGLRKTAEDREESNEDQAMPIVPLSEENDKAIRNKTFQRFLKKVGLSEPRSHEEIYWRIPGELTPSELRIQADSIEPKEGVEAEPQKEVRKKKSGKKSSARYQMLKQMALSKRKEKAAGKVTAKKSRREMRWEAQELARQENTSGQTVTPPVENGLSHADLYDAETDVSSDDDGDDDVGQKPSPAAGVGARSRVKRTLPSDSSSDDSDYENLLAIVRKSTEAQPLGKSTKRNRLASSDESDSAEEKDDNELEDEKSETEDAKITARPKKRSRMVSSDEDDSGSDKENEPLIPKKASPVTTSKSSKRASRVFSGESESELDAVEKDDDDDDDDKSEIMELVSEKPKPRLKKQSPFDFSDEDEEEENAKVADHVAMETGPLPTQTDSSKDFRLVLSSDSPSDVEMEVKDDGTTEEDEVDGDVESAIMEDNASNFAEDDTNNGGDDNASSQVDNQAGGENENVEVVEEYEEEGEWEEIMEDDSDYDIVSSNQGPAASSQNTVASNPSEVHDEEDGKDDEVDENDSDSDSDDDVPLNKISKRRVVMSDSEDD